MNDPGGPPGSAAKPGAPSVHAQPQAGMRAQERLVSGENGSYLSNLSGYLQDSVEFVSGYVPSALRSQLPAWSSPPQPALDDDRDKLTWSGSDVCEMPNGERRPVLCVCYGSGFQVWDTGDSQDNVHELLSRREPQPIKCIRFLPQPLAKELPHHPFYQRRPLLAVLSMDDNPASAFANTMLKVYSAATGEYINTLNFSQEILAVLANRRFLVLVLRSQVHGFDAVSMERVFTFRSFPHPLHPSPSLSHPSAPCAALGARWLAYASREPVSPSPAGAAAASPLKEAASSVASGLYYLGDVGRRKVAGLLYPPAAGPSAASALPPLDAGPASSPPQDAAQLAADGDVCGTVHVYDLVARRTIAHFKAHTQPLSAMAWDPSGALLVTVSNEAHHFNVWLIAPAPLPPPDAPPAPLAPAGSPNHYHLYKLVRGMTGAVVQSLSFSRDSKWLAVSSARGTTHLYALHPQGGQPSTGTHLPDAADPNADHAPAAAALAKPFVALAAYARIKPQRGLAGASVGPPGPAGAGSAQLAGMGAGAGMPLMLGEDDGELFSAGPGKASAGGAVTPFFQVSTWFTADGHVLVMGEGTLTKYHMVPHGPQLPTDLDPKTLFLSLSPLSQFDLCRRKPWPELRHLPLAAPPRQLASPAPAGRPSPQQQLPGSRAALGPDASYALLGQVELVTHASPYRPLWAGPQFVFKATAVAQCLAALSLVPPRPADDRHSPSLPASKLAPASAPVADDPPAPLVPVSPVAPVAETLGAGGRRKDKKKGKNGGGASSPGAPLVSLPSPLDEARPAAAAAPAMPELRLAPERRPDPSKLPLAASPPAALPVPGARSLSLAARAPGLEDDAYQPQQSLGRSPGDDLKQSILSAMATPLMSFGPAPAAADPSPSSSPLQQPLIEFHRPAQP